MSSYVELWLVVIATLMVLGGLAVFLRYREDWSRALMVRADLSFIRMLQLERQGIPVRVLLDSYIRTRHARIDVSFDQYLTLHRSGGNPTRVSMALVAAHIGDLPYDFDAMADIELHKKDAFEFVQDEIQKKTFDEKKRIPNRYAYR